MPMARWLFVVVLLVVGGMFGGLLLDEVPRGVAYAAAMLFGVPACLLMESNLDRRRRSRAAR